MPESIKPISIAISTVRDRNDVEIRIKPIGKSRRDISYPDIFALSSHEYEEAVPLILKSDAWDDHRINEAPESKLTPEKGAFVILGRDKEDVLRESSPISPRQCGVMSVIPEIDFSRCFSVESLKELGLEDADLSITLSESDIRTLLHRIPGGGIKTNTSEIQDIVESIKLGAKGIRLDEFASVRRIMERILLWNPPLDASAAMHRAEERFRDTLLDISKEKTLYVGVLKKQAPDETVFDRLVFFSSDDIVHAPLFSWEYGGVSSAYMRTTVAMPPSSGKLIGWRPSSLNNEKKLVRVEIDASDLDKTGRDWFTSKGVEYSFTDDECACVAIDTGNPVPRNAPMGSSIDAPFLSPFINRIAESEPISKTPGSDSAFSAWMFGFRGVHEKSFERTIFEARAVFRDEFSERVSISKIDKETVKRWFSSWRDTGKAVVLAEMSDNGRIFCRNFDSALAAEFDEQSGMEISSAFDESRISIDLRSPLFSQVPEISDPDKSPDITLHLGSRDENDGNAFVGFLHKKGDGLRLAAAAEDKRFRDALGIRSPFDEARGDRPLEMVSWNNAASSPLWFRYSSNLWNIRGKSACFDEIPASLLVLRKNIYPMELCPFDVKDKISCSEKVSPEWNWESNLFADTFKNCSLSNDYRSLMFEKSFLSDPNQRAPIYFQNPKLSLAGARYFAYRASQKYEKTIYNKLANFYTRFYMNTFDGEGKHLLNWFSWTSPRERYSMIRDFKEDFPLVDLKGHEDIVKTWAINELARSEGWYSQGLRRMRDRRFEFTHMFENFAKDHENEEMSIPVDIFSFIGPSESLDLNGLDKRGLGSLEDWIDEWMKDIPGFDMQHRKTFPAFIELSSEEGRRAFESLGRETCDMIDMESMKEIMDKIRCDKKEVVALGSFAPNGGILCADRSWASQQTHLSKNDQSLYVEEDFTPLSLYDIETHAEKELESFFDDSSDGTERRLDISSHFMPQDIADQIYLLASNRNIEQGRCIQDLEALSQYKGGIVPKGNVFEGMRLDEEGRRIPDEFSISENIDPMFDEKHRARLESQKSKDIKNSGFFQRLIQSATKIEMTDITVGTNKQKRHLLTKNDFDEYAENLTKKFWDDFVDWDAIRLNAPRYSPSNYLNTGASFPSVSSNTTRDQRGESYLKFMSSQPEFTDYRSEVFACGDKNPMEVIDQDELIKDAKIRAKKSPRLDRKDIAEGDYDIPYDEEKLEQIEGRGL